MKIFFIISARAVSAFDVAARESNGRLLLNDIYYRRPRL